MLLRIAYIIVIVFSITMGSCYITEPCGYGIDSTNVNYSANFVSNAGKEPVDFLGDSINGAVFGIRLKTSFVNTIDPYNECTDYTNYNITTLNIRTLRKFNSSYPQFSYLNDMVKVLNSNYKYPVPLEDARLTNDNYLLFDQMPDSSSLQQFQIIASTYYTTVLNVTLVPIKILR